MPRVLRALPSPSLRRFPRAGSVAAGVRRSSGVPPDSDRGQATGLGARRRDGCEQGVCLNRSHVSSPSLPKASTRDRASSHPARTVGPRETTDSSKRHRRRDPQGDAPHLRRARATPGASCTEMSRPADRCSIRAPDDARLSLMSVQRANPGMRLLVPHPGGVAQLVERHVRNVEVGGSSPLTSTPKAPAQGLFPARGAGARERSSRGSRMKTSPRRFAASRSAGFSAWA